MTEIEVMFIREQAAQVVETCLRLGVPEHAPAFIRDGDSPAAVAKALAGPAAPSAEPARRSASAAPAPRQDRKPAAPSWGDCEAAAQRRLSQPEPAPDRRAA